MVRGEESEGTDSMFMSSGDGVDRNLSSPAHLCQQAMYLTGIRVQNSNTDPRGGTRVGAKSPVAEGAGAQGGKGRGPGLASRQPWQ